MECDKYSRLVELVDPAGYTQFSTEEDLGYTIYFRQVCKRYNIDFAIRMAERGYHTKRA